MTDYIKPNGAGNAWDDPEPREGVVDRMKAEVEAYSHLSEERHNVIRAKAAYTMRVAGADFDYIATQLGYVNAASAQMAIERYLAAAAPASGVETQRALANAQIDNLMFQAYDEAADATNPDRWVARRFILDGISRKADLNGIKAPIKIEHIDPTGDQFATLLAMLATSQGLDMPVEADPLELEAEVVDDDDEFHAA